VSNLLQLASPVATIVAAGVAVYFTRQLGKGQLAIAKRQADIADQQGRLADIRMRHDLFDRRFEIYEAARNLLLEVFSNSNVSNEALRKFVRDTEKSVFFFDQGFTDYLLQIRHKAISLQKSVFHLEGPGSDPIAAAERRNELSNWFYAQFDVLLERSKPFLALDKGTATRSPPE